ncbi:hypothetical protein [Enterococcus rotai]|uniref:hypothetical protein n=1 Tax=Enterococcus rotai TaxID=118060 RepID=UPI0035C727D6
MVFVVEHCENCSSTHAWCTRHDEKKYKDYAVIVAAAIKEHVGNCDVIFNLVPKQHAMSDIYC